MKEIIWLFVMMCWAMFFGKTLSAHGWGPVSSNWLAWFGLVAGIAAVSFTVLICAPILYPERFPAPSRRPSSELTVWTFLILFSFWTFGFEFFQLPQNWSQIFPLLDICGLT
jgi:hypothetical protein